MSILSEIRPPIEVAEVQSALKDRIAEKQSLLPQTMAHRVVTGREDEVSNWVHSQAMDGLTIAREEEVGAGKGRFGVRPIALWGLAEQVVYRVLANRLEVLLGPPSNSQSYADFLDAPIAREPEYVLSADIAACYQYIDHDLLVEQLASTTGNRSDCQAMAELAAATSGQRVGLPQSSAASDVIADAHLAPIDRRLTRQGFDVWRYNDDFRFATNSWPELIAALEALDSEVRRLGFVLNDSKTVPYLLDTYKKRRNAVSGALNDLSNEVDHDLSSWEPQYMEEPVLISPDQEEIDIEVAGRILAIWSNDLDPNDPSAKPSSDRANTIRKMLNRAISGMDPADPANVERALKLLTYEKQVTPRTTRFLGAAIKADPGAAITIAKYLEEHFITDWQKLWLLEEIRAAADLGATGLGNLVGWTNSMSKRASTSPYLGAHAYLFVASSGASKLEPVDIGQAYDSAGVASKPVLAAAMGLAGIKGKLGRSVTDESVLNRWAYSYGQQAK